MSSRDQIKIELMHFARLVAYIWDEHYHSINHFAQSAGVSWQTTKNIIEGRTKYPSFATVALLGEAVGLTLSVKNGSVTVKVRKSKRKIPAKLSLRIVG